MVCRDGAATVPVSGSRRPPRLASTGRRLGRPLRDRRQRVVPNRADLIEALAVPVTWSVRRTCWSGRPPATYWAAARPKDVLFRDTEVRKVSAAPASHASPEPAAGSRARQTQPSLGDVGGQVVLGPRRRVGQRGDGVAVLDVGGGQPLAVLANVLL